MSAYSNIGATLTAITYLVQLRKLYYWKNWV